MQKFFRLSITNLQVSVYVCLYDLVVCFIYHFRGFIALT